jgi:CubicO group peptidase (beta-lactamase class C family)
MKRIAQMASALLCCAAAFAASGAAGAGTKNQSPPIDDKAVTAFIDKALVEKHIPGISAALIVDGDVIWAKGFGVADIASQRPVTPETLFVMASVSKTVVAAALMHAVEHHALSLDADINTYLPFPVRNPHFPDAIITARQLATHTSSINDGPLYYGPVSYHYGGDNPIPLGSFLAAYLTPGGQYYDAEHNFLAQAPGKKWQYSNVGAGLEAYVVESATGMRFEQYCAKNIFEPLGMVATAWHQRDVDMTRHAIPYAAVEGQFFPIQHFGLATWPDGGLRTTTLDLARFVGMIAQGGTLHGVQILSSATVHEMLARQAVTIERAGLSSDTHAQAIIWRIDGFENGTPTRYSHGGADPGAATWATFDLAKHIGVVVFANTSANKGVGDTFDTIVDLLFKATHR